MLCYKSVMYATNAFERPDIQSSYENLMDNQENFSENPMSLKLFYLDIYDEEQEKAVNFYDLPSAQQALFVDKMLEDQRNALSEKLQAMPELVPALQIENTAIEEVLQQAQITQRHIGDIDEAALRRMAELPVPFSYTAPGAKQNRLQLFKTLRDAVAKKNEEVAKARQDAPQPSEIIWGSRNERVDPIHVRNMWASYAQRGHFVVSLPIHGKAWAFVNVTNKDKRAVGHAAVITRKVNRWENNLNTEGVTVESLPRGVIKGSVSSWNRKHYIMGVQRVQYRWRWRWFKSWFYKEHNRVSNPWALAEWAERYVGRGYVRWYEFATAKWAAPARFTCATLIWWCAKKAYNINVSDWYSPLVSPSGLYTDESTYLIAEVR